jgi:hypothetical protein
MQIATNRYERELLPLWYDRERWPYAADKEVIERFADWLKQVSWSLFCTLTFAWKVSDGQGDRTFLEFINRLEYTIKADVGYVRGDEKRISGCGQPASGRHYHAVLTSTVPMEPAFIEYLWMGMAGRRADGAGAKVQVDDPQRDGVEYVLKLILKQEGDWKVRKLELFHPEARSLQDMTARFRRRLRRYKARQQKIGTLTPFASGASLQG